MSVSLVCLTSNLYHTHSWRKEDGAVMRGGLLSGALSTSFGFGNRSLKILWTKRAPSLMYGSSNRAGSLSSQASLEDLISSLS
jgi:hypothetical protein